MDLRALEIQVPQHSTHHIIPEKCCDWVILDYFFLRLII